MRGTPGHQGDNMEEKRNAGQGMIEYAMVLILVAIAVLLAIQLMGGSVSNLYCRMISLFNNQSCAQTYCQDSYSNLSGSQMYQGVWNVSTGKLCSPTGGGVIFNKCSMSATTPSDYTVALNNASLTAGNGYGIYFRMTNTGSGVSGYAFQYDPGANGFVIRKWVNGAEIFTPSLAQVSAPAGYNWYGSPHTLSVKVVGNTFTGYLDGVAILTAVDSTYTSGGTGIRTWDSTALCVQGLTVSK
jgi:Flp pilus assembly pilin Flp